MSSIWWLSVAVISASGGTTGPVLDWLRISMFASPVRGSKSLGGYATEIRNSSPLFWNRPLGESPEPEQRPPDLQQGACMPVALRHVQGRGRDLGRRALDPAEIRQPLAGPPQSSGSALP